MKRKSILMFLIPCVMFTLGTTRVFADDNNDNTDDTAQINELSDVDLSSVKKGDTFTLRDGKTEYRVVEEDFDNIYIGKRGKNKLDIYHFEIETTDRNGNTTWRKFVKLDDLCNESNGRLKICDWRFINKKDGYGSTVNVTRQYSNSITEAIGGRDEEKTVYYSTDHRIGSNNFKSLLYVSNKYGSTPDEDDGTSDNDEDGRYYRFGEITNDDVENSKFDTEGVSTADVETLIDSNNDIYISLRFLSEALGARVDWLSSGNDDEPDDVLIRFYDSDDYCKELNIKYNGNLDDNNQVKEYTVSEMYNKLLEAIKSNDFDVSMDMKYSYYDDIKGEVVQGKAVWNKLYLSGPVVTYSPRLLGWMNVESKNVIHFYRDTNYKNFLDACPNNVQNGTITNFDNCFDITGIIMYYGVPVPIDLLHENDKCTLDGDFEDVDNSHNNYNNNNDDNDNNGSAKNIIIGDSHVSNMSKAVTNSNDIDFKKVSNLNGLKKELNNLADKISSNDNEEEYTIAINMGIDEIYDILSSNKSDSEKTNEIKNLAEDYVDIYNNFYSDVKNNNVNIYFVPVTPVKDDNYNTQIEKFNTEVTSGIKSKISKCNISSSRVNFEYDSDDSVKYADSTYKNFFKEIEKCM